MLRKIPFLIFTLALVSAASTWADFKIRGGIFKKIQSGPVSFDVDNDGTAEIIMDTNANLGIGSTTAEHDLHVFGNGNITEDLIVGGNLNLSGNFVLSDQIFVTNGSNSAPTLAFSNDPDTGMFLDGTNKLALATAGTNAFVIDANQNVGIGTMSPGAKLEVVSTTAGVKTVILRGNPSDNANILEAINNSGNTVASIGPEGQLTLSPYDTGIVPLTLNYPLGTTPTTDYFNITSSGTNRFKINRFGQMFLQAGLTNNSNFNVGPNGMSHKAATMVYVRPFNATTKGVVIETAASANPFRVENASGSGIMEIDTNGGGYFNGSLAIGPATASANLHIAGNLLIDEEINSGNILPSTNNTHDLGSMSRAWRGIYSTEYTMLSDRRYKKDITPLSYGLDEVMKMSPVTFRWKSNNTKEPRVGLIAQEVQEVISEVISVGNDAIQTLGVKYQDLIPVLIKAIQEQHRQTESRFQKQEKEIQGLKAQLKNLIK